LKGVRIKSKTVNKKPMDSQEIRIVSIVAAWISGLALTNCSMAGRRLDTMATGLNRASTNGSQKAMKIGKKPNDHNSLLTR